MKQYKTFFSPVFADGGKRLIAPGDTVVFLLRDGTSKASVQVVSVENNNKRLGWSLQPSITAPTATEIVTDDADDLDTVVALANELKAAYNDRQLDVATLFTAMAEYGNPTSSQNATAEATNLATTQTLLNALKVAYNAAQVDVAEIFTDHPEWGAVTSVQEATANASNQDTAEALANSLKAKMNTLLNDIHEAFQKGVVTGFIPRSEDVMGVDYRHSDQRYD